MPDPAISINKTLDNEGGHFVPEDNHRGASKWGITLKTAVEEFHLPWSTETIRDLTREQAFAFYRDHWWPRTHLDLIRDQSVCDKIFDLSVNLWIGTAVRLLQRALETRADGILGPQTADAVNSLVPSLVLADLRNEAELYYRAVASNNPKQAGNLDGWLKRLELV